MIKVFFGVVKGGITSIVSKQVLRTGDLDKDIATASNLLSEDIGDCHRFFLRLERSEEHVRKAAEGATLIH